MTITYRPIGYIHSPFTDRADMPIQPTGETATAGAIEILPEFEQGLADLAGFSHIILIYHFDQVASWQLQVTPFLDSEARGVFATRAPTRPNPIGLSVVKLLEVKGNILSVANLDVLDGTPLLDIKPYVAAFDHPEDSIAGWLAQAGEQVRRKRSDNRFSP